MRAFPAGWGILRTVPHRDRARGATAARLPVLLSLAVLLLLAVLAARGSSGVPHGKGLVVLGGSDQGSVSQGAGNAPNLPGRLNPVVGVGLSTVIALALVACLVCMAMLLVLLASLRGRGRNVNSERTLGVEPAVDGGAGEAVRTLLQGTRSALSLLRGRAGGPAADAVQRAWLALEEAAAECGTARRPDQTPTEFTGAVLAAHAVDAGAVVTLRGLYQRARFGRADTVTDDDADRAVTALDSIASSLAAR